MLTHHLWHQALIACYCGADSHMHDVEDLRLQRQQREAAAPAAAVAAPGGAPLQQQAGADSLSGEEVWATPPSTPLRAAASEAAPSGGLLAAEGKPCGLAGMGDGAGDGSEAAERALRRTATVVEPMATERSSAGRLQALGSGSGPRRSSAERLPPLDAGALAGPAVGAALEASALSPLPRLSASAAVPQGQAPVPAQAAVPAQGRCCCSGAREQQSRCRGRCWQPKAAGAASHVRMQRQHLRREWCPRLLGVSSWQDRSP